MNSSNIGIFVLILFAYCTTTQSHDIDLLHAVFENGAMYSTSVRYPRLATSSKLKLIRTPDVTYQIEETKNGNDGPMTSPVANFGINGIDTMLDNVIVVRTNNNSFIQIMTITVEDAQQLFFWTTLPKLGRELYSYDVSAVYQYEKGCILENVSISGYKYSTVGNLQERYIIHSGAAVYMRLTPHLLWTEDEFYYSTYVKFRNHSDLANWVATPGQHYSRRMPVAPSEVVQYFHRNAALPDPLISQ